jgi:hypothetical protein
VPVARASVEQRIAGEQRRPVAVGAQADVAHRGPAFHAFELDGLADLEHVTRLHAAVDPSASASPLSGQAIR